MNDTLTPRADGKVFDTCGKCYGDGVVHYGNVVYNTRRGPQRTCHRCNGTGGKWVDPKVIARRERRREREAEKARAEAALQASLARAQEEIEAHEINERRDAFAAANPTVVEVMATLTGEFGDSIRSQYNAAGELTAKQVEVLERIAAERAADPEPAPVVEGRIAVTGRIITTKYVENQYGGSVKMLVLDDRGFKVWGTMPRALEGSSWYEEDTQSWHDEPAAEKGDRVTFTAQVERSDDDETFGFFKRPTKAEKL